MNEDKELQTDDDGTAQEDPTTEVAQETNEPVELSDDSEDVAVRKLKDEAAQNRIKLRESSERLEGALERVRALTLATTSDVLADPLYSLGYDPATMDDDDGLPDAAKVRKAAEALAASRPFLARGPRGDVGQGEHSASVGTPSISQLLRQAS